MSVSEGLTSKVQESISVLSRSSLGVLIALPGQFVKEGGDAVQKTKVALAEEEIGLLHLDREGTDVRTYPLQERIDDLLYILTEVKTQTNLPVGILGSSLGNVVMLAAMQRYFSMVHGNDHLLVMLGKSPIPGIEAANLNPQFPVNDFLRGYTGSLLTSDFRGVVYEARTRGIYVGGIMGDCDSYVPQHNVRELFSPDLCVIQGADHAFSQEVHFEQMLKWIVNKAYTAFFSTQR